jgi:hypothetical protein
MCSGIVVKADICNDLRLFAVESRNDLLRQLDNLVTHDIGRVGVVRSTDAAYEQLRNAGPKFFENLKVVQSKLSTNRVYVDNQVSGSSDMHQHKRKYSTLSCAGLLSGNCAICRMSPPL